MKLKELKWILSSVKPFHNPKLSLEQYTTPPEIAAHLIYSAHISYNDIYNKKVLDMCSGTGILAIAASFFNPATLTCVEIDTDAIEISKANFNEFNLDNIRIKNCLYEDFYETDVDTVFMNPPFGTREKGADVRALDHALTLGKIVYSLHKKSTRSYFLKKYEELSVIAEMKFDLPCTYGFHKSKNKIIEVDLYRTVRSKIENT